MTRRDLILVWLTLVGAMCGPAAAASLVLNPGFETGDFTNWTVTGDGIAIDTAFPNSGCCDAVFTATTTDPDGGVLSQTLSTVAGKSYTLSFAVLDEAGYNGDTFTVQFGGFSATITGDEAAPPGNLPSLYTTFSFTVPAADILGGTKVLAFKGLNDPVSGIDWNLDDISVNAVATPEPSTWTLFVIAFAGFAMQWQARNCPRADLPQNSFRAVSLRTE